MRTRDGNAPMGNATFVVSPDYERPVLGYEDLVAENLATTDPHRWAGLLADLRGERLVVQLDLDEAKARHQSKRREAREAARYAKARANDQGVGA